MANPNEGIPYFISHEISLGRIEPLWIATRASSGYSIDELRRRAFLSHISAYTQAGFLDLPLCDKIEVGLTIKLDDLCSQEGLLQIRAMGVLQVRYYFKHPSALLADANYLQQNWNSILSEVYYYLNGTRSGTDEAVYELIDLLLGQQIQYYYDNVPGFYLPDY